MRVAVLGARGHFGGLLAGRLQREPGVTVIPAGRDNLDIGAEDFPEALAALRADVLVHAAGPYVPGDLRVARACIAAGVHYIDLADDRRFVRDIVRLDTAARERDVLVVSGASSVPALSGAVIDRYAPQFARLVEVDMGISASSCLPGVGTLRSVLSYAGKPIPHIDAGQVALAPGWFGLRRHRFVHATLARWVCECDVPDLDLLPKRHPTLRTVRFCAGTAVTPLVFGLRLFAGLVRRKLIRDPASWAPALHRIGERFASLGDGRSAMFVTLRGFDRAGEAQAKHWELHAQDHRGMEVPTLAAVALVRKLADGTLPDRGATPCVGLLTLADWEALFDPAAIRCHVD